MGKQMKAWFTCPSWSLQLLDGWNGKVDDGCATISSEGKMGALQMSAAIKPTQVKDDDLYDFAAEQIHDGTKTKNVQFGEFVGFEISFSVDDDFFRMWYLRHERKLLFVTYICDLKKRGVEDEDVQKMLVTLMSTDA